MLVILMNDQLISPQVVCQGCLMADQHGQPRWHSGKLLCGRVLQCSTVEGGDTCYAQVNPRHNQYECQMGFRVADID